MVTSFLVVKNRAYTKLLTAIDDVATGVVVTAGQGSRFPDTFPFDITIEDEIMRCTNRVTDTLTVTRAQQSTSAVAHSVSVKVSLNITAKSVTDLNTAVNALEDEAVMKALFDANTILYATSDDTPVALTVAEQRLVGRKTGGSIAALSGADALLAMGISATVAELNYVDGVTSAIQTQLDAKVAKSLFDAYSIIYADTDDTPVALSIAASRLVGRKSSGGIVAISPSDALDMLSGQAAGAFDLNDQSLTGATLVIDTTIARAIEISSVCSSAQLYIGGTAILASGEQAIYIDAPSETVATNGIWITLKSTVTSGDLTGVRSRVYGNAASAGANVRGGYFEAKMEANKYAAMLEGILSHADYSAGGVTISGDVRGFTAHISQGSGLNAANLYGGLINIQTRGDENITTDDVGLMIRNEAVGGNGRTMDAALKIADLNMGGGIAGFTYDIIFQGGSTLVDDGTTLTLAGAGFKVGGDLDMDSNDLNNMNRIYTRADSPFYIIGKGQTHDNAIGFWTPGVSPGFADTQRLVIEGRAAEVRAMWSSINHIGIKLGSTLNANNSLIDKVAYIGGGDSQDLTIRGNSVVTAATERSILFQVLDAGNDVRITVMTCQPNGASPYLTLNRKILLNGQVFDAGSGNAQIDTTGSLALLLKAALKFDQSDDSVAVADEVSLSGYEISAGHRALAISCEEAVITESLTSDRTLPIRINGVTYKLMLVAV